MARDTDVVQLRRTIAELEAALEGGTKIFAWTQTKAKTPSYSPLDTRFRRHDLTVALAEMTRHAGALQRHIDNIESSRGWRLFNIYRRIKDSMIGRAGAGTSGLS